MAAPVASILTPSHLHPPRPHKMCPKESRKLSISEDEMEAFNGVVIVLAGSDGEGNTSPLKDDAPSDEGVMATIPSTCEDAPTRSQEVKKREDIVECTTESADPTHDNCTATIACTETIPVVFACSVEQVRAADEADVQCSLRIYRQEANIVLRQPRVAESILAFNQRDEDSHEDNDASDSLPYDSQDPSENTVKLPESISQSEDDLERRATYEPEKSENNPSNNTQQDNDSLPPLLMFLAAAAAVALVAAVVHPLGANLSSGIIAIAVFLSLSKWYMSARSSGWKVESDSRHARPHLNNQCTRTVPYYIYFFSSCARLC